MCGIAGIIDIALRTRDDELRDIAERMASALRHRGPDSSGTWQDATCGIALAHTRLAIIDVSPAGHQPMTSANGRFVMSFNGEIYNHDSIRSELAHGMQALSWRGHSDTETILAAFSAWGVEQTLSKLRGMFAIAVWDREQRSLILARDRMGEKPLYYGWLGNILVFGSELKALEAHPLWKGDVDRDVLSLYMRHGHVPGAYCIYSGIKKLLPGTFFRFEADRAHSHVGTYWSLVNAVTAGVRDPFKGSPEEATDTLEAIMKDAVAEQMVADVPLGAFLSGGIDSSTIVALMQAKSHRPVCTFTIGFQERDYDESDYARGVAKHLGTKHVELILPPEKALETIAVLPQIYDEPFGDPSQLPTVLVAQIASKDLKVALSGDGGDELFSGYDRYARLEALIGRISQIGKPLRRTLGFGLKSVPPRAWDAALSPLLSAMGQQERSFEAGMKVHKWADMLALDWAEIYLVLMSSCTSPGSMVLDASEPLTVFTDPSRRALVNEIRQFATAVDLDGYLPDDILVKVDRAAMSVGLETRVPMLDPRVVAFALSLPKDLKVRNGQTKWVLRQVLHRYLPPALFERPKKGFSVPIATWLRGPLRPWAEALLDSNVLREQALLAPKAVARSWKQFLAGNNEMTVIIWNVLMFQAWLASTKRRAGIQQPALLLA